MSPYFKPYSQADLQAWTPRRAGEVKLGQKAKAPTEGDWQAALQSSGCRFAWIGIPEDIGVRANGGIGGAQTAPEAALKALLGIQHTPALPGDDVLLLGEFDFDAWLRESDEAPVETLRDWVAQIDEEVASVIRAVAGAGLVPVVVGGGHNNCYGLLRGVSEAWRRPVNAVNLDAHADFRALEGRHSGNGFRYAREGGYLDAYSVCGLHENYNNPAILSQLTPDGGFHYSLFESIYVRRERSFEQALTAALAHVSEGPVGVELDLDAIEGMLASAATPSGVPMEDARRYAWRAGRETEALYLHLCEGVRYRADGLENPHLGKAVAYLATDFMKGVRQRRASSGL